jgi:hypothetical protein
VATEWGLGVIKLVVFQACKERVCKNDVLSLMQREAETNVEFMFRIR